MLPELPIELQAEIVTYLDTPSLCFFARTSRHHLRVMHSHLRRRRQQLLNSPPIKLVLHGWGFFCHTSNAIYACGANSYGQLGLGHTKDCATLTRLPQQPPGDILQVVAGIYHTLMLTDQGLYACGDNRYGPLGLGHTNTCTTFTRLEQQPPGVILQMVVGKYYTLVLTNQGLYACGKNNYGQLGLGHINTCTIVTRLEEQPPGIILQMVAGISHTLVLTDQGLYACGDNGYGQLGLGHTNTCTTFTRLEQQPPGVILQIVFGTFHTLVLTDQGLYACGSNKYGQLGLGRRGADDAWTALKKCTVLKRLPQQPLGVILQVVAGAFHTLVLTNQGLYACGFNSYGQLGPYSYGWALTTLSQQLPGGILQVVANDFHILVLTDQGLYACGRNNYGQLGLGHTDACTTLKRLPQQPPGVILQTAAGVLHTLVLTDRGLYACGSNRYGQLGLGHTNFCTTLTALTKDQVPLELQQFQALCHQLNVLIRFSQTESPLPQPERLNLSGNPLPQA